MTSVKKFFVKHVASTLDGWFDVNDSVGGSAMILPGRKAVAFLPLPNFLPGANNTALNNYRICFGSDGTGIPGLMPWHSEFATVADYFDTVGAWVTSVLPGETAFEVATDFAPVIEWSQPLLPSSLLSSNVTVIEQASGNPVAVGVGFDYDTNRMTLSHATPFLPDATYTVTLGTGFVNLMGKPLLHPFTWSFRTRPPRPVPVAGQGPFVQTVSPADFSTNVGIANLYQVILTFSEAMAPYSFRAATLHLRKSGTTADMPALIDYFPATRTLWVSPMAGFAWGTRYELTLDATAIYTVGTVGTPSQKLQGQSLFVFTTAPDPAATGGGGSTGTSTGTAGSQDPEKTKPLILSLSYGDPEIETDGTSGADAGATLSISITLPDGSQREQEMPNATNEYATRPSPEIPAGSTVIVTPRFLKGSDPEVAEEIREVQAAVSPLGTPEGSNYYVSKQGTAGATASPAAAGGWEVQGPLPDGNFTALVQNGEKLAVVPLEITISRQGAAAPDPALVVKLGDTVTISLLRNNPLGLTFATGQVVWKYRQLKPDGTYTNWTDFGPSATGAQFDYTTLISGIFQVEAYFANDPNHPVPYLRQKDDPKTADGVILGPGKRGEPNAFGVCSSQMQINLCDRAESWLGSTAYDPANGVTAQYGFSAFPPGSDTCNMFCAHMGCSVGATVPAINGVRHSYPPLANQWAGTLSTDIIPGAPFSSAIHNWSLLPATSNPEPGFIIAHPSATPTGEGHCAILDYDGWGIGAGASGTVNRNYKDFYDGTSRYRTYVEGLIDP